MPGTLAGNEGGRVKKTQNQQPVTSTAGRADAPTRSFRRFPPMSKPAANPFKQALREKRAQIGLWLSGASPYLGGVSAPAGFDWLLMDGEHAPTPCRPPCSSCRWW